jgi:hypothetical protein
VKSVPATRSIFERSASWPLSIRQRRARIRRGFDPGRAARHPGYAPLDLEHECADVRCHAQHLENPIRPAGGRIEPRFEDALRRGPRRHRARSTHAALAPIGAIKRLVLSKLDQCTGARAAQRCSKAPRISEGPLTVDVRVSVPAGRRTSPGGRAGAGCIPAFSGRGHGVTLMRVAS